MHPTCAIDDCPESAAEGSRYCPEHWHEQRCSVRDCADLARQPPYLCEAHTLERLGWLPPPLFVWLRDRQHAARPAPQAPTEVPGLGLALGPHGLPAGQEGAEIEEALLRAGVPSAFAPTPPRILRAEAPREVPPDALLLLEKNARRFTALLHNEGPAEVYILAGPHRVLLAAERLWQAPLDWRGELRAVWCGPAGVLRVTEIDDDRGARVSVLRV